MDAPGDSERFASDAVRWALSHSMLMAKHGTGTPGEPMSITHAPFTLWPSKFPEGEFKRACELQRDVNVMVENVARDVKFLNETLESAASADEFTRECLKILNTVTKEGVAQPIRLGLFRSDYMLDFDKEKSNTEDFVAAAKIKQVEVNTISVSFGSLGVSISNLHRYMQDVSDAPTCLSLPSNGALDGLAKGLATAWEAYGKENAVVMMVVLPDEHNVYDQSLLEYALWEQHKIRTVRYSLEAVNEKASLDENHRAMTIDGHEIAVAYFRAGYAPDHYTSQACWDGRLLIERSLAVKCPDMAYHLAGAKKVQQVLADPEVLQRFVAASAVPQLLSVFAGLYPVDVKSDRVHDAIVHPERYVLKPQREGGGNNLYGDELKAQLSGLSSVDTHQFILMDRITPPAQPGVIVRDFQTYSCDIVGELGVFGVVLSGKEGILRNETVGHLLRSKPHNIDDGGVAAGVAVLDSPQLVELQADPAMAN